MLARKRKENFSEFLTCSISQRVHRWYVCLSHIGLVEGQQCQHVNMFHCSEIYDITTSYDPVKKDTACPLAGGGSWWLDNDIIVRISKVCQRRYKREKTAQNKEDVHAERFSSRLWLMRVLSTLWRWRAAKSFLLCFLSIKDHLTLRIFVAITCKLKSTVVWW